VAVSVPQRKHAYRTWEFDNFDVVIGPLAAGTLGLRNAPGRASANSAGELTDTTKSPTSFAALKTRVADTLAGLAVIQHPKSTPLWDERCALWQVIGSLLSRPAISPANYAPSVIVQAYQCALGPTPKAAPAPLNTVDSDFLSTD
jgi:hypothetical protein